MIAVKFLLGIAIVGFTSLCGYFLSNKFRQRKVFFQQFKTFNQHFLNELAYYKRPLDVFISTHAYKGEFHNFLVEFLHHLKGDSLNVFLSLEDIEYKFLNKDEKDFIRDYFITLGKGDGESQKAYFSASKDNLNKICQQTDEICKKYSDLYIKLGFLFGLLLLILIL